MSRRAVLVAACAGVLAISRLATGQVVINEFMYDDTGTDDREFVELYNSGTAPVSIGGWTLTGRDPAGANTVITIDAGTTLQPGQFFVIGNPGTLNVNQTADAGFLENDNETIELVNGTIILDADVSQVDLTKVMGKAPRTGKDRTRGFFGFAGHNDPVEFKDISIKEL